MSQATLTAPTPPADERVRRASTLHKVVTRPELGSLVGAIAIYVFFYAIAPPFRSADAFSTILYTSSTYGIMVVGVSLLMIGGEFDLSAGVAVYTAALFASLFAFELTLNVWLGVLASLAFALIVGFFNGYVTMKTKIPSFLVTLGTFFMFQGLNIAITQGLTNAVATPSISNMTGFPLAQQVFASQFTLFGVSVWITVVYWIVLVAIATWILLRTKVGNWIFAVGGDAESARAVGVPVVKTKIGLFMGVGFLAWFSGMHVLFRFNSVQSGSGVGNEFIYIIAAVIGGCLLTGGFGTAIGAAIGAFIYGMANQGIIYAGWNPDLVKFFLGVMLLGATLANLWFQRRARR